MVDFKTGQRPKYNDGKAAGVINPGYIENKYEEFVAQMTFSVGGTEEDPTFDNSQFVVFKPLKAGNPVWSRISPGLYKGSLPGAFEGKTVISQIMNAPNNPDIQGATFQVTSTADEVILTTCDKDGVLADNLLFGASVILRFYNSITL